MFGSPHLTACASWRPVVAAFVFLFAMSLSAGCGSTSTQSAQRDVLTAHVGQYPPPPAGAVRPRVGVPEFSVQGAGGFSGQNVNELAADQMVTLLDQTERFRVVERNQLEKLLEEQDLEGVVRGNELARRAKVRGVDFLLLGRVTNLRVKTEQAKKGFGLGQIGGVINTGGFDYKDKSKKITTEAGVDIRLVDPTTGEVMMSNFSEYERTDSIGAFGIDILGASAEADADVQISEDDKGKILRLALDDALRKSLPKIDRFLTSAEAREGAADAGTNPPANTVVPRSVAPTADAEAADPAPATAKKSFCSECGKQMAAGAKFCPSCGAKTQ